MSQYWINMMFVGASFMSGSSASSAVHFLRMALSARFSSGLSIRPDRSRSIHLNACGGGGGGGGGVCKASDLAHPLGR